MKTIYAIAALFLLIGAIAGIFLSAFGLFSFWRSQNDIQHQILSSVDLIGRTITSTTDGLLIVNNAIVQAKDDLALIEEFTFGVADAVGNTRPTLETVSDLFGEDLTDILLETQTALEAAEGSAMLIDDTLRIISAIPFVGTRYAPSQPLGESIAQISSTLEELPQSLSDIQSGLDNTADDLFEIETSIDSLAERIGLIESNLNEASEVIVAYQDTTAQLQENLSSFQQALPQWVRHISIWVSILFVWVSFTSLGMFSVGLLMWKQSRRLE